MMDLNIRHATQSPPTTLIHTGSPQVKRHNSYRPLETHDVFPKHLGIYMNPK